MLSSPKRVLFWRKELQCRSDPFFAMVILLLAQAAPLRAQSPFSSPPQSTDLPPREVKLVDKKWEALTNHRVGANGQKALAINPSKWKHAETDNFIIHYRRVTEADKVAREIEYDLWFVAKSLGAKKEQYQSKSHVYVFEDEAEWKEFLPGTGMAEWTSSYAHGDELFLNVRRTEATARFDSGTLAHETTHAVVARLYPGDRWPIWLNEGFAEYMSGASIAARKNQTVKRHQRSLDYAGMPLDQMIALTDYPPDVDTVHQLYQTSEKLVRFLMNDLPKERFPKFVAAILGGKNLEAAFLEVYGDKYKDFDTFKKKYDRFQK